MPRPAPIADPRYQRIYATVDSIPRGRVATYGQVATEAMLPRRARLVGRALRELPTGSALAWHRVIGAGGRIRVGEPSAREQRRRLVSEGVRVDANGRIDLAQFAWKADEPDADASSKKTSAPSRTRVAASRNQTGNTIGAKTRAKKSDSSDLQKVLDELERRGLLLQQDAQLPNVVRIVTGETLRSSWWSHPRGRDVFRVLSELAEHRDVLLAKLVGGKVTLVHRALWPALAAVAMERAEWQTRGLSAAARRLLARVDAESSIAATGAAAKELEVRLLVASMQRHTQSGEHELVLESWTAWTKRSRCKPIRDVEKARATIGAAAKKLGISSLPWSVRLKRRERARRTLS